MTKESIYELQRIDCNCNDCKHLFRLFDKQNNVLAADKISDEELFYLVRERKANNIQEAIDSLTKHIYIIQDAPRKIEKQKNKLKILLSEKYGYQGQKTPIQYGVCLELRKEITFIPNICQLDTQKCFVHRKDSTIHNTT